MRITFIANQSFEFVDADFEEKGVGGSEYALILMTRALALRGHYVEVFGRSKVEGVFHGVRYLNISRFIPQSPYEILILFRASHLGFITARARKKLFWSTDIDWSDWDKFIFPFVEKVICISEFHRDFLLATYRSARFDQLGIIDHGVIGQDYFAEPPNVLPAKAMNRIIYCSVPERGLSHLGRLFPIIRDRVPTAELVITSDYSLWGHPPGTEQFQQMLATISGVSYVGKIPRAKLVELQRSCKVMAYPCTYHEGFCISAMECIAAGTIPVTTNAFALVSTVGSSGILIDGQPGEKEYDERFVESVVTLLTQDCLWRGLAIKGRMRAFDQYRWHSVCEKFERILAA